jgi:hypothetical protein
MIIYLIYINLRYDLIKNKSYQSFDTVSSTITTKVKYYTFWLIIKLTNL